MSLLTIDPLGDRAFLLGFAAESTAAAWAGAIRDLRKPGVVDVVLAYRSIGVFFDPDCAEAEVLEDELRNLVPQVSMQAVGRLIVIPVLYDGADLGDVAAHFGLSATEVIDAHSGTEYNVFAIGFLPGFPYAGYLPSLLSGIPRRTVPRVRVPGGSVAIAGKQTGIYPVESPGGWQLLGRTPLLIADLVTAHFPIQAGDRLRFEPITPREFEKCVHERL